MCWPAGLARARSRAPRAATMPGATIRPGGRGPSRRRTTPYNMVRQDSLGGSAASPLIISWPREMGDVAGGVRDQYHHAGGGVPTILDCADVDPPQTHRAHVQRP